jgi:hypothetical protein
MVFSSKKSLEDLYSYFQIKQKCGFGLENENGFGDFEIIQGR